MNNKRVTFYFISFLILVSLFGLYVLAAGADTTEGLYRIYINTTTSKGTQLNNLNITTGENLNITCFAERSFLSNNTVIGSRISNISLYHNFNGTGTNNEIRLNIT